MLKSAEIRGNNVADAQINLLRFVKWDWWNFVNCNIYLGQSIQEWTKWNLWPFNIICSMDYCWCQHRFKNTSNMQCFGGRGLHGKTQMTKQYWFTSVSTFCEKYFDQLFFWYEQYLFKNIREAMEVHKNFCLLINVLSQPFNA